MPDVIGLNNGATLSVSAGLPATYDSTGFNALTFTSVGEIIDIGAVGKSFEMVSHQSISTAYPKKFKGTYDVGDVAFSLARDTDDAGHVILAAAIASTASYSFKIITGSGEINYFTGKLSKMEMTSIGVNAMRNTSVTVAADPQSLVQVNP